MFESPDYRIAFEPLLNSEQAAEVIKVHPKTLQRYARNGIIAGVRIGKLWRFRRSEIHHSLGVQPALDGNREAQ